MKTKVSDRDLRLSQAEEFQLAMTAEARTTIWSWLHGDQASDAIERGLMCVLTRSPGRRRLTYLVREVVPPEAGDIALSGGVDFNPSYRRRVKEKADARDGGVLYLHTHPGGRGRPSRQDLESGKRLLHNDAQHLNHENPPLAIGIVTPREHWMVLGCEYPPGKSVSGGQPRYATAVRVAGDRFEKLGTFTAGRSVKGAAGPTGEVAPRTQDRQIRLWTEEAQRVYAGLRAGIVGLGGGGSILAGHVARAGVDSLVLADYDVIEDVNLNRQQGSSAVDASVERPKVDVAAREAKRAATNPSFDVTRVRGSVVEEDPDHSAYLDLLDCDVILHAADGHWTTQVLDQIAHAHLIPVISGGTRPTTNSEGVLTDKARSPITVSSPGHPCFRCSMQYFEKEADKERHGGKTPGPDYDMADQQAGPEPVVTNEEVGPPEEEQDQEPAPSVISLNAIVAGMMHLRLQDLTLGVTGYAVGGKRFLPGEWEFQEMRDACREECDREDLAAAGATHIFPLSKDHNLHGKTSSQ